MDSTRLNRGWWVWIPCLQQEETATCPGVFTYQTPPNPSMLLCSFLVKTSTWQLPTQSHWIETHGRGEAGSQWLPQDSPSPQNGFSSCFNPSSWALAASVTTPWAQPALPAAVTLKDFWKTLPTQIFHDSLLLWFSSEEQNTCSHKCSLIGNSRWIIYNWFSLSDSLATAAQLLLVLAEGEGHCLLDA